MQAIYFADALKIKWLENLTYLFPASTVLVITKEGGCLLSLNSSSKCKECLCLNCSCIISSQSNLEQISYSKFQFAYLGTEGHSPLHHRLLWRQRKLFSGDSAKILIYFIKQTHARMRNITSLAWSWLSGLEFWRPPIVGDLIIWSQTEWKIEHRGSLL